MPTIGVKVELDGAQAYKQNMSQVVSETKLYQAEVKNLAQQIKNGTNAFSNHIAQGKALEKQLAAQKEQEKLLKAEIERVAAIEGENSQAVLKLKTQYENLETAIAKTEAALKENGGTWGAISAEFDAIGSKLGDIGGKMQSFGSTLTTSVTAPIAALGGASLAAFNEVDNAFDTVIKKTGATGDALAEMEGIVEDIATSMPTSFDKAAEAVGEVNTRFGSTGEELQTLSEQFVKFAEINGVDVSNSIDTVQKALSSYGLGAEDAAAFLDRMNKVGQDTGVSVDKLASGIVSNGTAFQELGLNIDEAVTFMGQLEKSGANSETVLNGMRKALKAATAEGKPLDEALAELQSTIENGTDSMDGLTAAYDVFGKSGDQIYSAIKNGTINFEELVSSMDSASGSVSNTFEATIDPVDELQMHLNELKVLGTDIANQLMPFISQALEKLGEIIQKVSDAWNGLSEEQQQMIIKIAGIAAVVGPVIAIVGKAVSFIGSIVSGVGALIGVLGPFLPVIVGVGAAIAAVVLIVKNWGAITDWIKEKWAALTDFLGNAVSTIQQFFSDHFGILGDLFATRIEIIKIIITSAIELIKTVIQTFGALVKAIFTGDWEQVGVILTNAWLKIKEIFAQGILKIIESVKNLGVKIKEKFTELKNNALNWGKDFVQSFVNGITERMHALIDKVRSMAETVRSYLHFTEPDVGPLVGFNKWPRHLVEQYAEGIDSARYLVRNAASGVASDISDVLMAPLDSEDIYNAVRSGAAEATTKIVLNDREITRALSGLGVVFNG